MSRKNNKLPRLGVPSGMTAVILGAVLLCALAGLGYLWQRGQIDALGKDIREREARLEKIKLANANLTRIYSTLCSHTELDKRVRDMNLGLGVPLPQQIVTMSEPSLLHNPSQTRVVAARASDQGGQ